MPDQEGNLALIALGANLKGPVGGPEQTLQAAIAQVAALSEGAVRQSALYRTPAVPAGGGPDFVNGAMAIIWSGAADALLARLHGIESDLGRTRQGRWGARAIDLDLIALGAQIRPDLATQTAWAGLSPERAAQTWPDDLILPHPRLAERAFVLVPLAEVAGAWVHPVLGQSVAALCAALPAADRDQVRLL